MRPRVYLAQRMTNLYCDDLLKEARNATKKLEAAGFEVLSPVLEEDVPDKHIKLINTLGRLKQYWARDKWCLNKAHILLDLNSQGKSDGVNVELGYFRFCLWKPLIRIYPTLGCTISRLEYDCVTDSLDKAIEVMKDKWGTKQKLRMWRLRMLNASLLKFMVQQVKFLMEVL